MSRATPAEAARWRRHLRHALLLPVALLFVLLEGLVWRSSNALLRGLDGLPALSGTRWALSRLPGWAALPMFLVPEAVARVGEVWTALLLLHGHIVSAALVYVLVRVVAALVAVFIWRACADALMRLAWFAVMVGWLTAARRWALGHTAPIRGIARRASHAALQALRRGMRTRR